MSNPIITKQFHFCAAHQYGHKKWSQEKNTQVFGKDAKVHGHNYTLEFSITGDINPDTGWLIDLEYLKKIVNENVIKVFDHSRIESDIPWFQNKQPSSENMVIFIWGQLNKDLKEGKLHHIRLIDTETIFTDYYGD